MERRSWLWRRKSSEKSPGETESSGSLSSHSERFSDDQAYSNHNAQSPEVTSKVVSGDEENSDDVKILREKLSAALSNISAKEDLVKQHSKVAEEAVSGWEKAEDEVVVLKKKLENAAEKNTLLEDRVSHLDGALKECVRQLRQAREEQEQKVHEAVAISMHECESTKSALENQVVELQAKLEAAQAEIFSSADLRRKLEVAEKEILDLKLQLHSRVEELELRVIERDLSTQAAEAASKQHLESIKKMAKLEAECRRLKAVARKMSPLNDYKSCTASSTYVESLTDSQSDCGERLLAIETDNRKFSVSDPSEFEQGQCDSWASALITELDQFKNEKALARNLMVPHVEMNLMDDFLEMEKLVASPETEKRASQSEPASTPHDGEKILLKAEFDSLVRRAAELEEKLENTEREKIKLEIALSECQEQLQASQVSLKETELKFVELQSQLALANELRCAVEEELDATDSKKEKAELEVSVSHAEIQKLLSKIGSLGEEVEKEKSLSADTMNRCQKLEDELSKFKLKADHRQTAMANGELKIKQETELAVAASKLAECQQTIASLGQQLKSLATLEDFLTDSDKLLEPLDEGSDNSKEGREPWKLHSGDLPLPKNDSETPKAVAGYSHGLKNGCVGELMVSTNQITLPEKSRNGFGKLFSRNKGGKQPE